MKEIQRFRMATVLSLISVGAMPHGVIDFDAELISTIGSGPLTPYYMSLLRGGILTQRDNLLLRAGVYRPISVDGDFSYSYGLELVGGGVSKTSYGLYDGETATWQTHRLSPPSLFIQQLYADIRYRSLFLSAGMKSRESLIVNNLLSTGDVIESGNARPIPQMRVGFIDYQDIPFTGSWLQITGEIAYGKFFQNKWLEQHNNRYANHYNLGTLYHYKRCYFRTNPDKAFSATFGGQFAVLFGGETFYYYKGEVTKKVRNRENLKAFWQALFPVDNGVEGYYEGQHLGSWDIALRYRLTPVSSVRAYMMNLWEDGSGMGKLNGWDGLWGIEYQTDGCRLLSGVVVEYIDFTNQGGAIHWDPEDNPGTTIDQSQATGADDYYNNGFYNSYANFGMAIGNSFSRQPLYNLDGSLDFRNTRVRGINIAVMGNITDRLSYRLMGGHRISFGTYFNPSFSKLRDTSVMVESSYRLRAVEGLRLKGQFAMDRGSIYGNLTSFSFSITYSCSLR